LEPVSDRGIGMAQQGRTEAVEWMSTYQIFRAKNGGEL